MFKKLTRKDKRTNLEKEIDSVIGKMSVMAPDPNADNRTNLDREIDSLLVNMQNTNVDSDEYSEMVKNLKILYEAKANDKSRLDEYSEMTENLERLYKAKANVKTSNFPWEAVIVGAFGLVEILVITKHEKLDIITSKALGFVTKGRV
jgi:hypothetical protein